MCLPFLFFPQQKDFDLRELREFNKNMMKLMGEVIHTYPDITPSAHMLFSQVRPHTLQKSCRLY